jgi:hypothetical protein
MKISSLWKLTYDPAGTPIVLLDFAEWIEEELRFPLQRGVEAIPLVDAAAPFLRSTGNASVQISVAKSRIVAGYSAISADTAAREAELDALIALAATTKKPLQIQISGFTDHYWRFASCVLGGMEVTRMLDAPVARILTTYSLTCAGLAKYNGTP